MMKKRIGLLLLGFLTVFTAVAIAQSGPSDSFTDSTVTISTITELPGTSTTTRGYAVRVVGVLRDESTGTETEVSDTTVDSNLDLESTRQAFADARQAVEVAHQQSGNGQLRLEPAQLANSSPVVTDTSTEEVDVETNREVTYETITTFGPALIFIGEERSVPYEVGDDETNFNTVTTTEIFIDRTTNTTTSTEKSAEYRIVGVSRP